jgi:hypothetical protein
LTQTLSRIPKRFTIFIPVEGIEDLCKLLTELTGEFGDTEEKGKLLLRVNHSLPCFRGSVASVPANA